MAVKTGALLSVPDHFPGTPLQFKLHAKSLLQDLPNGAGFSFFRDRICLEEPVVNHICDSQDTLINFIINNTGTGLIDAFYNDRSRYRRKLYAAIDLFGKKPIIGCCLNEEDNATYYSGYVEQYIHNMLRPFANILHEKGIAATNGGLTADAACYAVYLGLMDEGKPTQAQEWAQQSGIAPKIGWIKNKEYRIRTLLSNYLSVGLDYLSIHWYERGEEVVNRVLDYLHRLTSLPVIITEFGNLTDPSMVTRLPIDIGIVYSEGQWQLFNKDGSLNAVGTALKEGTTITA